MAHKFGRNRTIWIAVGVVAVVLVGVGLGLYFHNRPGGKAQSAGCPDVMLVSIPGTAESSPQQDPLNPTQFPNALLLNVTAPLAKQFDASRLQVYTVPYTAQFHRPFTSDDQMNYDDSRTEGTAATKNAMAAMAAKCPLTDYVIIGFSQGAVIGGDIASDIGNGRGPVAADRVLGTTLIADGRRQTGVGQDVGPNPDGEGAEIVLYGVPFIPSGMTMTGPRNGGFGALNDRTNQICAQSDLICAAPKDAFSLLNLPATIETLAGGAAHPVHALYNTPEFWAVDGQPATAWTANWASQLTNGAPHPVAR
ncbi:MAG: hypothetical protein QOH60_1971 [Mycobacterium sp.]|nr:hypothetical protein [Mycobacterium sp.]